MQPAYVVALSLVGFFVLWVVVAMIVSWVSGWRSLAAAYPCARMFPTTVWRFRSIHLRGSNYGGCVTFGADATDLCVRMVWIMRPGHAPFCVPWHDVRVQEQQRTLLGLVSYRCVVFTFARVPGLEMLLDPKLAREILEHPDLRSAELTVQWLDDDAQT